MNKVVVDEMRDLRQEITAVLHRSIDMGSRIGKLEGDNPASKELRGEYEQYKIVVAEFDSRHKNLLNRVLELESAAMAKKLKEAKIVRDFEIGLAAEVDEAELARQVDCGQVDELDKVKKVLEIVLLVACLAFFVYFSVKRLRGLPE